MFIPIGTDAPLYHRPFATIALIAINGFMFVGSSVLSGKIFGIGTIAEKGPGTSSWDDASVGERVVNFLCLNFGEINPIQWVTSMFMHADPLHLIGNMIFLWTFGLIVEGKVGWWKFVAIYLSIGILQSGFEQILVFPFLSTGGSLGASSAIFGLMAIAVVWAPKNEVEIVGIFHFLGLRFFEVIRFEASILFFVGFNLVMEVYGVVFAGTTITSAFLHLMGAVPGFIVGFGMLLLRLVDCEGWDLIAVFKGEEGEPKIISREREKQIAEAAQAEQERRARTYQDGMQWIDQYLSKGLYEGALGRFQVLKKEVPGLVWKKEHLYEVIRGFHQAKRYVDSIPLMNEFIQLFPGDSGAMGLKLVQIYLVHAERPQKALKMAQQISDEQLFQEQQKVKQKLMLKAQQMIEEGAIDLED